MKKLLTTFGLAALNDGRSAVNDVGLAMPLGAASGGVACLADPLADRLLLISVVNAHGLIIVQTIWAITADRYGRRETRSETVTAGALGARLGELAVELCCPAPPPRPRVFPAAVGF
jgi:hypothetical protein